jgi:hypothetical protein
MSDPVGQKEPPEYIHWDDHEREGLLSRIGTFSPAQRNLFHELCRNYRKEIPVQHFVSNHGLNIRNAEQELTALVEKLSTDGTGYIRVNHHDGSPAAVVLTDPGDIAFFTGLLTEEYRRLMVYPSDPFPTRNMFEEKHIPIPDHYISPLDEKTLTAILEGKEYPKVVYEVTTAKDKKIIASGPVIANIFDYASYKIKNALANPEALGMLAELKSTSLLDIRKRIEKKDEVIWLDLSKTILKNVGKFHPPKKYGVGIDFFQSAALCVLVLKNRLQDSRRKEEEKKARRLHMESIAAALQNRGLEPCSPLEFAAIADVYKKEYGSKYQEFLKEFHDVYTVPKDRKKLPVVLIINHQYIHRDNLFPYFERRLSTLKKELLTEYISIMDRVLRTNDREGKSMFYSFNAFSGDIGNRIALLDPLMGSLFKRPDITAEGLIHHIIHWKKIKSKDDIKRYLEIYFVPGSLEFRGYPVLLGISILEVFDSAFSKLPVWRQLLLKISGKYESQREKYAQRSKKKIPLNRLKRQTEPSFSRRGGKTGHPQTPITGPGKKGTRNKNAEKKRNYSKKELESAWKEFEKLIK